MHPELTLLECYFSIFPPQMQDYYVLCSVLEIYITCFAVYVTTVKCVIITAYLNLVSV